MTALDALSPRGRHHRPPLWRRLTTRWHAHRQQRHIEAARDDAYVVRIAPHGKIPPAARARATVHAYSTAITDAFDVPPAAVLPDEDVPGLEHLQRTWGDDTGTFTKITGGWMP